MIPDVNQLSKQLKTYEDLYWRKYYAMMANKLGLDGVNDGSDISLIAEFEKVLGVIQTDMTIFYQLLIDLPLEPVTGKEMVNYFKDSLYTDPEAADITILHAD